MRKHKRRLKRTRKEIERLVERTQRKGEQEQIYPKDLVESYHLDLFSGLHPRQRMIAAKVLTKAVESRRIIFRREAEEIDKISRTDYWGSDIYVGGEAQNYGERGDYIFEKDIRGYADKPPETDQNYHSKFINFAESFRSDNKDLLIEKGYKGELDEAIEKIKESARDVESESQELMEDLERMQKNLHSLENSMTNLKSPSGGPSSVSREDMQSIIDNKKEIQKEIDMISEIIEKKISDVLSKKCRVLEGISTVVSISRKISDVDHEDIPGSARGNHLSRTNMPSAHKDDPEKNDLTRNKIMDKVKRKSDDIRHLEADILQARRLLNDILCEDSCSRASSVRLCLTDIKSSIQAAFPDDDVKEVCSDLEHLVSLIDRYSGINVEEYGDPHERSIELRNKLRNQNPYDFSINKQMNLLKKESEAEFVKKLDTKQEVTTTTQYVALKTLDLCDYVEDEYCS